MLLPASDSTLLIVDMQGRLMPVIHDGDAVLAANVKLAQAARLLEVPVVATEHHSKMLGVTARAAGRTGAIDLPENALRRRASRASRAGCRPRARPCW